MIYPYSLNTIDSKLIEEIISSDVEESDLFDFKEKPYQPSKDSEKKDFIKDVVSFMNNAGGLIIIGVTKNREVIGLSEGFDLDRAKCDWGKILNSGIEPHIMGILFKTFTVMEKTVLVMIVPSGAKKPYCLKYAGEAAMYFTMRQDGINQPMKYSAVVEMILGERNGYAQAWSDWRKDVIVGVLDGKWTHPLEVGPCVFMIINPVNSGPSDEIFSPLEISNITNNQMVFKPPYTRGWTVNNNAEGVYVLGREDGDYNLSKPSHSFITGASNGAVVVYDTCRMKGCVAVKDLGQEFDQFLSSHLAKGLKLIENLGGIGQEYSITVAFVGARGLKIKPRFIMPGSANTSAGIPKETFEVSTKFMIGQPVLEAIKPIVETLWRVSGFSHCERYDESGKFIGGIHEEM